LKKSPALLTAPEIAGLIFDDWDDEKREKYQNAANEPARRRLQAISGSLKLRNAAAFSDELSSSALDEIVRLLDLWILGEYRAAPREPYLIADMGEF
jgi:hypothetical protein